MKKVFLLVLVLWLSVTSGSAQVENLRPTATPNATSIAVFGQIPVDYFAGTPQIDIPLYTYRSRDISVPIGLSYHSGNFRPSDHSSWVGLGWTLQSGGMITRVQNDLPDELIDDNCIIKRGFFYNYNKLVFSGWNSVESIQKAATDNENEVFDPNSCEMRMRTDNAPDEFQFNFLGMSGSLIMGQDGAWHQKGKGSVNFSVTTEIGPYAVWEPNLNTSTIARNFPSLVRHCLSQFVLTAGDGTKYFFGTDTATNIDGYTSATNVQYFSTPDSNAVEFARVGAGYSNEAARGRDGGTVPMTWLLTKILSTTGDSVVFRYTRDGPQVMASATSVYGSYTNCSLCNPQIGFTYGAGDVMSILDGSTLSSITGANGSVQCSKSRANILDYQFLGSPSSPQDINWGNTTSGLYYAYSLEIFQGNDDFAGPGVSSVFMELDNLKVLDNAGNPIKSYAFDYIKSPTNRLWLNTITETGADGSTLPPYSLSYNNPMGLDKVPYNTVQIDHWGYYTAKDPFAGLFAQLEVEPVFFNSSTGNWAGFSANTQNYLNNVSSFNSAFNAGYIANRNPVDGPSQYGLLQQITYPTGGSTQFVWELNQYAKFLNGGINPASNNLIFTVQDIGANVNGPGVRIHQIVSQAGFNAPPITKTYTYYRDLVNNNHLSSGVLNSAQPSYCDEYSSSGYDYQVWSSQDVNATHYTNGSPIGYTNVQEQNSDGSFKTFTYSNQDNGYQDWNPSQADIKGFGSPTPVVQSLSLTSMELERGQLLQENSYRPGPVLLEHKGYQYNNDPSRFEDSINLYTYQNKFSLAGASITFTGAGFMAITSGPTLYFGDITCAISQHYQYPWLQSDTVTEYDQNGTNPLSVVTSYTYDLTNRNKRTESFTSSKNEPVVKSYNYTADLFDGTSSPAQQARSAMFNAGMTGIPLEQIERRSGIQTNHSRVDYQSYLSGRTLLVPGQSWKSSYAAALDPLTQYINYDSVGNISEYITRDGLTTCYDWGYNAAYPVVKITNANNTQHSYPVTAITSGGDSYFWPADNFNVHQFPPFNVQSPGTIEIKAGFGSNPGNQTYTFNYSLTGPGVNTGGQFCLGAGVSCPMGFPTSGSVPVGGYGQYTLTISPNSTANNLTVFAEYSFPVETTSVTTEGSKNYFYDGFEENSNSAVVSGAAHTGSKYWSGSSYSSGFSPPDNNAYTVEWWQLQSGSWVYHTQAYSLFTPLTGPVDDVRIFPAGSMMSTYTYRPLIGMTSQIDPKGFTTYYLYDAFGRVSAVLDKDRNVLKRYCYNYMGQSGSCPVYTPPTQ